MDYIRAAMIWGFISANGDWKQCIKFLSARGINVLRLFINYMDGDEGAWIPQPYCPYKDVGQWNPAELNGQPGYAPIRIVDMSQLNVHFLARMTEIAHCMSDNKMRAWLCMDDKCSEPPEGTQESLLDPNEGNVQMFPDWNKGSLRRAFSGGNQALELIQFRATMEKAVFDIFKTAGHDIVYADQKNEYGYVVGAGSAYPVSRQLDYEKQRNASLRSSGYTIVNSLTPPLSESPNREEAMKSADLYDHHCLGDAQSIDADPDGFTNDMVIVNTDGYPKGEGKKSVQGYGTLSVAQATALAPLVSKKAGFCLCFQEVQVDRHGPCDVDVIDYAPAEYLAIGTGYVPSPPPPPVEYVWVTIDAATDMVANPYCPSPVSTRFIRGHEPTAICTVHHAPPAPVKPCSYFLRHWNFIGWIRCVFGGKH